MDEDRAGDGLIEIRDPEIDATAIMEEIRQRIAARREEAGYEEIAFPTFGAATPLPEADPALPGGGSLHYHLRLANQLYNQMETAPLLTPSPATRLPLLGRLWGLIREQTHQLVLFYVNRLGTQQTNVNRHLVSVVNELTRQVQEQQREIRRLEQELATATSAAHEDGA